MVKKIIYENQKMFFLIEWVVYVLVSIEKYVGV